MHPLPPQYTFRVDLRATIPTTAFSPAFPIANTGLSYVSHNRADNTLIALYRGEHSALEIAVAVATRALRDVVRRGLPDAEGLVITYCIATLEDSP